MSDLGCRSCGGQADGPLAWRCPVCGSPLDIVLPPADPGTLIDTTASGVWRYRGWLPAVPPVSLGEPTTGLVELASGQPPIVAKVEGGLPTGSFKDRGSAVLIAWLRARGAEGIVADSSGNAGASLAAYAARASLPARVFVPAGASPAKLVQVRSAGATVVATPGPRAAAGEAAVAALADPGGRAIAYASHLWQPAFLAGTATFAYELWEGLGRRPPAVLVTPLGGGTLLLGAYRGFKRLLEAGLIDRMPRLVGVQSSACAPLADAYARGEADVADVVPGATIAEGIRIARPPRSREILAAIRATRGTIVAVTDDEVRRSLRVLLAGGLFVEPTSAAAHAGVARLVDADSVGGEPIAIALTGHGLKTTAAISELG